MLLFECVFKNIVPIWCDEIIYLSLLFIILTYLISYQISYVHISMIRFQRSAFLEKAIKTDYVMKRLFNHLLRKSLAIFNRKIIFPLYWSWSVHHWCVKIFLFGYFSTTILVIVDRLFPYLPTYFFWKRT